MAGTSLQRIKLVGDVIFLVLTYPQGTGYALAHAYPVNGVGVTRNVKGMKIPVPLDASVLR